MIMIMIMFTIAIAITIKITIDSICNKILFPYNNKIVFCLYMKIYSLLIYDNNNKQIYNNYNLESFFILFRPKVKEIINDISYDIINQITVPNFYKIVENLYESDIVIYCLLNDKFYVVITDGEYSQNNVISLFDKLKDSQLSNTDIDKIFSDYKCPEDIDQIIDIKNKPIFLIYKSSINNEHQKNIIDNNIYCTIF